LSWLALPEQGQTIGRGRIGIFMGVFRFVMLGRERRGLIESRASGKKRLPTGTRRGLSLIRSDGGHSAGLQIRIHDCIAHKFFDNITVAMKMVTADNRHQQNPFLAINLKISGLSSKFYRYYKYKFDLTEHGSIRPQRAGTTRCSVSCQLGLWLKKFHLILHLTSNKGAVKGQWWSNERAVEKTA
jgi:hypothetical protein